MVLAEVLVAALRSVEGEELGLALGGRALDLLPGSVLEGVWDLCSFAEGANAYAENAASEEGGDYGEEDVAAVC